MYFEQTSLRNHFLLIIHQLLYKHYFFKLQQSSSLNSSGVEELRIHEDKFYGIMLTIKFSSAYKHCPAEFMVIMVSHYWLDFRKVYARWNMPSTNIWKFSIRVPKTNRQNNRMIICWIITPYKLPITQPLLHLIHWFHLQNVALK